MPRDTSVICDVCSMKIGWKKDLKRHKQLHAPKEQSLQYRCTVDGCGKSFRQYINLNTHVNTHTGKKPHQCADCAFRCNDPSSLTKHMKKKHSYVPKLRGKLQVVVPMSKNGQERNKGSLCIASSSSPRKESDAQLFDREISEDGSLALDVDAVDDDEMDHSATGPNGLPTEESRD